MLRFVFSVIGATILSVSIFWVLQTMIKMNETQNLTQENVKYIDFVRLKKEQQITKKERVKPKKPKPLKKPKPKVAVKQKKMPLKQQMVQKMPLNLNLPINLSANGILGDARVSGFGGQVISTNVIPLSRVNPVYPRRAKRLRIEGNVQAEFTITTAGTVKDIVIIKAEPKNIFDTAVKRSLLKWRFKPKKDKGKAIEQRASLKFNFKLEE